MLMDCKFLVFLSALPCLRARFWLLHLLLVSVIAAYLNTFRYLFVTQFIENAITCKSNEVILFGYLEGVDVWNSHDDIGITSTIV